VVGKRCFLSDRNITSSEQGVEKMEKRRRILRKDKEFELDEWQKRVKAILGKDFYKGLTKNSLSKYRRFLEAHITLPCVLTGIEDFQWEEFYVFGPGSKKEYEKLKKTNPSYTDKYEFIRFEDEIDPMEGLLVIVKRISDQREFIIPLRDLEVTNKKSDANYQIIDDYAVWAVNQ
jgi:hypothetical protein